MILSSNGNFVNPDDLAQTLSYNGSGQLSHIEVTAGTWVYRQTYTYADGKLSVISQWVKQ